jgi:uncharacterized protein YutD
VKAVSENNEVIKINQDTYEVLTDYRNAWDKEAFLKRYTDVLSKYDYIVGDWGYEQLRLRGFFEDDNRKAAFDSKIGTLPDYIYEFCNFGCAYFVIKKTNLRPEPPLETLDLEKEEEFDLEKEEEFENTPD